MFGEEVFRALVRVTIRRVKSQLRVLQLYTVLT